MTEPSTITQISTATDAEIAVRVQAECDRANGLLTNQSDLDYTEQLGSGWYSPRTVLSGDALASFTTALEAETRDDELARFRHKAINPELQHCDGGWDDDEDDLAEHIDGLTFPADIRAISYGDGFWTTYTHATTNAQLTFEFHTGSQHDVEKQHLKAIWKLRATRPGTHRHYEPEPENDFDE